MILKKDFNIVYQPHGKPRRRFIISVNRLSYYLPENRVKQVMSVLLAMTSQKERVGLYNSGLVDIYRK